MKLTENARGVFPIAPTPFHGDGRIDEASIERLAQHWVQCGADGATVLGIMGEAPKLTGEESVAVARRFIRGMDGLPVIVGVSAPGFAAMRALAHDADLRAALARRGLATILARHTCAHRMRELLGFAERLGLAAAPLAPALETAS